MEIIDLELNTFVSGISDADLMPNIISRYTIWSEKTIVFLLYKYADIDFYHFHVKISYELSHNTKQKKYKDLQ